MRDVLGVRCACCAHCVCVVRLCIQVCAHLFILFSSVFREIITFNSKDEYQKELAALVGFGDEDQKEAGDDEEEDEEQDLLDLMDMSEIFAAQKGGKTISGGILGPNLNRHNFN